MSVIGSSHAPPGAATPVARASSGRFRGPRFSPDLYWNALDNPFVYDDFRLIVENTSILDVWNLQSVIVRDMTRPMVNVSYAIDTWLWGRRPVGYHVTNVLLHAVNVMLVFWVAFLACEDRRRQAGQRLAAGVSPTIVGFATAMVFALHPMMTQAVGYISARSEVAYSTLFLLAFLAGRRWMLVGGKTVVAHLHRSYGSSRF